MSDLTRQLEAFEIDAAIIRATAKVLHSAIRVAPDPVTPEMISQLLKSEADLRAALDLASMARRTLDARAIDALAKEPAP